MTTYQESILNIPKQGEGEYTIIEDKHHEVIAVEAVTKRRESEETVLINKK